jgi:hypothetical protein
MNINYAPDKDYEENGPQTNMLVQVLEDGNEWKSKVGYILLL